MEIKNYPNYQDLPKEIKPDYKPINEKGDFARKTALENSETTHQLALLENDAFGELEESIKKSNLSIDDIVEKLKEPGLNYNEGNAFEDLLLQNIDLQKLKGGSIDEKVEQFLKKSYLTPRYSKILSDKIVQGIETGNSSLIGEVLKDKKVWLIKTDLIQKLTNDEQLLEAFNICKENKETALSIVDKIENIDLALKMYLEILESSDMKSYSDKSDLEKSGKILASKLFKSGAKEKLIDLIKKDTLKLSYYKEFIHLFGKEQQIIIDLVKNSSDIDGIFYALKFVTDQKLLAQLEFDSALSPKLNKEQKDQVIQYAKNISEALGSEPQISILSKLNEDEADEYTKSGKAAKNKFVIGISKGKYIIAWSNMKTHEYHRDIFKRLPMVKAKTGGFIGLDKENGKIKIRMVRSSGDYGFYSQELLEHYRGNIEKALKENLEGKEFELEIKTSTNYE